MRKIFALVLVLAMVLSMFAGCGNANTSATEAPTEAPATEAPAEPAKDIAILYTNDVHTYIDSVLSYDVISGVKAELLAQGYEVLLVDAGDHIQGTAYGSMDKGETIIKLMNAAGYDASALGNHEFD